MNASMETEPFNIILITDPKDESFSRNCERLINNRTPRIETARLAIRKFLEVFLSMADPIAPSAASVVRALINRRKSATSPRAVDESGTRPA
jgi:hypothetical protein